MLVVTTENLPGYEIRTVLGEVLGVTIHQRNPYAEGVKALDGGRNPLATQTLAQSRDDTVARMLEAAQKRGANAVVGMRFDHRVISESWAEMCAYGTAVWVVPVTHWARRQYELMVAAGRVPPVSEVPA
ncbi:MAG TPA: YbjQ family protein [Micromonosporaceae bacterium]